MNQVNVSGDHWSETTVANSLEKMTREH